MSDYPISNLRCSLKMICGFTLFFLRNHVFIFQVFYQAYNFLSTIILKNTNKNQNYLMPINSQNILKIYCCIAKCYYKHWMKISYVYIVTFFGVTPKNCQGNWFCVKILVFLKFFCLFFLMLLKTTKNFWHLTSLGTN